jgi:hypothetical protein
VIFLRFCGAGTANVGDVAEVFFIGTPNEANQGEIVNVFQST